MMHPRLLQLYVDSLSHIHSTPSPFCCSAIAGRGKDMVIPVIYSEETLWVIGSTQEISYCPFCGTKLPGLQRKLVPPGNVATPLEEWEVQDAPPVSFIGAYIPRLEDDKQLLSVSRKNDPNAKGLPGGKVEPGETQLEALVREVKEETGLTVLEAIPIFDAKDDTGIRGVTFYVTEYEGDISTQESGVVEWMAHGPFLQKSVFQEYNRALLYRLGV